MIIISLPSLPWCTIWAVIKKSRPLVTLSVAVSPVNERSLSALFSEQRAGSFPSFTIMSYMNLIPSLFPSSEGDKFPIYNGVII